MLRPRKRLFAESLGSHDQQSFSFETGWCFAVNKTPFFLHHKTSHVLHPLSKMQLEGSSTGLSKINLRFPENFEASRESPNQLHSRRIGPNMVADVVDICQAIPHFFSSCSESVQHALGEGAEG
jgi:hypothetical protein